MMRLDSETTKDLQATEEDQLIEKVADYIKWEKPEIIIFEDYNKGGAHRKGDFRNNSAL